MKRKFLVEIDIPENTGDLCWDNDETGLQALHDCVVSELSVASFHALVNSLKESEDYQAFIARQINVRNSFKVIEPVPEEREKFTAEEIQEWLDGFKMSDENGEFGDHNAATLHNAYIMLHDDQDGIEAYFGRKDYYENFK